MVICSAVDSRGEAVMIEEDSRDNGPVLGKSVDGTNLQAPVWIFLGEWIRELK